MLSKLKAIGIWGLDRLHFDPYEDFTRPFIPSGSGSLAEKAKEAEGELDAFKILDGRIILNRRPRDMSIDTGDQATWHGFYTAVGAWKYLVTQDPADAAHLVRCVEGLRFHQPNVSKMTHPDADGFGGILCRGVDPTRNKDGQPIKEGEEMFVEWNASNDSGCGHLAGLWWSWLHGGDHTRYLSSKLLMRWAENIYNHNGALINPDGKPTKFGALDQGLLTDPLRITLLMAIYGAAFRAVGHPVFRDAGLSIAKKYRDLIPWGKVRWAWIDKHTDTHRAAVQLRIMAECGLYEEFRKEIDDGMERLWKLGVRQANPWIMLMCYQPKTREATKTMVRGCLSEFSVGAKRWNVEVDNVDSSGKWTVAFQYGDKGWRSPVKEWGNQLVALQPLPPWARGSQDFFYQRHPYSVRDWKGQKDGDTRHNSEDYRAVYWLSRSIDLIGAEE